MTVSPQAILEVQIEIDGRVAFGYSGDCLPPSWFDKSPEKDFRQQVDEMLASIRRAQDDFADTFATNSAFFDGWLAAYSRQQAHGQQHDWPALLSSFGLSMVERSTLDAICRAHKSSFFAALRDNLFGVEAGRVHEPLVRHVPADWLPPEPLSSLHVRHTVGLGDPLTDSDVADPIDDPFPVSLEAYVARYGQRYFKIKVSNQLEHDLARLSQIAKIVESRRGTDYVVTLDGNEQYQSIDQLLELVHALGRTERLATFWGNTVLVEQPLARAVALDPQLADDLRPLTDQKPVIIDESDGTLDSFAKAIQCGYRGVSTKNCKGPIKSILNRGLIWKMNQQGADQYLMSAEDLCCVGMVPLQADLCLVAALGIEHIERNGHHYHRGLSYLSSGEQEEILAAHPDLYGRVGDIVAPRIVNGKFAIQSLQCPGFGFAVQPDVAKMIVAEEWDFDTL